MKILYLKLKNFSQIFTAMGKRTIEIDFSKCKNNIVLLVGKNGSGKTSILSTLHPFAYPGNMDIRSGTSMIMENEDGYKEIHIDFDGDIYIIKHHYNRTSSGSLTVKSYISKNGEELNSNGNVTSFNETVYNELSLQTDYLKLLRLGSNVTNIIQMKAAERKNFTSELLNDIGMYTEMFKKISEDSRVLKRLIMAVSSKIERINVTDKDTLKNEIKFVEDNIKLLNDDRNDLIQEKGKVEGSIATLIPEGLGSFRDKIVSLKNSCSDKETEIKLYKNKLKDIPVIIIGDSEEYLNKKKDELLTLKSKAYSLTPIIESMQNTLNTYYNDRDELTTQMSTLTSDDNYKETENVLARLKTEVNKLDKRFENSVPTVTKDNIFSIISMMNEITSIVSETFGFGFQNVKWCISLIREGVDIDRFISEEIAKLDRKIVKITSNFRSDINHNNCIVLFRPPECGIDNCPYLDLYDRFFNNKSDDNDESVVSLETQKNNLNALNYVSSNIEYIRRLLRTNESTIKKLNLRCLTLDYILQQMEHDEPVYDERIFTRIVSEIEEYEEYQMKKSKVKDIEIELSGMKGNSELLHSLESRCNKLSDDIIRLTSDIDAKKNELIKCETEITSHENSISNIEQYIATTTILSTLVDEADILYEQIHQNESTLDKVKEYVDKLSYINSKMQDFDSRIKSMNDDLFNKNYKLREYKNLIKEQKLLTDKYDEIELIKESLSSTKGIPLLFIQLYFKNIKIFVNKLLESVYDDFVIEDFSITSTEFNIPYVKNGVRVNDVVYASQGETSFLSLALSFALINNSIKDYNILLLDEIDSTLDTRNRSMFLNIINQQIEMINAEQVFLITHNNMFDSYPVDIIITSDISLDNYTNANIIYKV